jgi:glycosyltransferase involved in cell wall biosynthesis
MANRVRIVLLLHELSRTGAPRIALDAFEAMTAEVEVVVIAALGGPLEEECRALGRLYVLGDKWPSGGFWPQVRWRFEQRRFLSSIRRWAPDLTYANSVASLPILKMLRLPEIPVLLHVHELHTEIMSIQRRFPDLLESRPGRYLAVSDAVRRALISEFGIDERRISLVHEFIPESRLAVSRQTRAGRKDGVFVVGGAGFPSWRKGLTLWLQMAAELKNLLGPSVRFVWVGVPEWPSPDWLEGLRFRREIKLLGLDDVVDLVPSTPNALGRFQDFDVFAMTSWEDPCPLVVLENMGIGTPVVCFAGGGGAPEAVADTGIIIPEFDPWAMARSIAGLAANPRERDHLGALARERMIANFTDRVQVPKIRREVLALAGHTATEGAIHVPAIRDKPQASLADNWR